jgi:predicted nuclease with TOPRIM domain
MAIKVDKPDTDAPEDQGWTKYQQLVLTELERHDKKLSLLEGEVMSIRLSDQRLEMEIRHNTDTLNRMFNRFETVESTLNEKITTLNTQRETINSEVNILKWKMYLISFFIAILATGLVNWLMKYILRIG